MERNLVADFMVISGRVVGRDGVVGSSTLGTDIDVDGFSLRTTTSALGTGIGPWTDRLTDRMSSSVGDRHRLPGVRGAVVDAVVGTPGGRGFIRGGVGGLTINS
jgi:hypothetical protein